MIPEWNSSGYLPAIDDTDPVSSRSPYKVGIIEIAGSFLNASAERTLLLNGLIEYRQKLYDSGIVNGFQWIDGSFVENAEVLRNCPPHDIDVVTFFYLPAGETQQTILYKVPELFDHDAIKKRYFVDSYYMPLGFPCDNGIIEQIAYWFGVWSHTRQKTWKGFLQAELNDIEDRAAGMLLLSEGGDNELR